ncbi:hypothetical protein CYMTET_45057 [Cymbomonas tetramitiformis]|uniref:Uncharacterized protein n=1 Tax=Cymbomonas tetramitiformis TaxID=36881 RepID=A0AAE0BYZ3_9CHLO|nr:hypothetical protein CYMTET_45057 [Cymbomonas tetramitiformis]|eukprot:gene20096-24057_t
MEGEDKLAPVPGMGAWQLLGITFFSACGGPFGFEECVGAGGGQAALLGTVLMPLVWSVPLALMTAELSCMIPESGGHIVWVERALGPYWGFMNGILSFGTNCFDNALYPVMFTDYLEGALWPYIRHEFPFAVNLVLRLAVIALTVVLNFRGADLVGNASVLFACTVLAPFILMVIMGIRPLLVDWDGIPGTREDEDTEHDWGSFFAVLLWNTAGFDNAGSCAAEVEDPGDAYPKALSGSILLVMVTYAAPTLIGIYYVPDAEDWEDGAFADVGAEVGGPWLRLALGLAGVMSSVGLLSTLMLTSSRMLAAMAATRTAPAVVALSHSVYQTPWVAILINAVITCVLIMLPFSKLAEVDMLFYCVSTVLKFIALLKLRSTDPDAPRPYKIPLSDPMLASFSMIPCGLCVASLFLFHRFSIITGVATVIVSSFAYVIRNKYWPDGPTQPATMSALPEK